MLNVSKWTVLWNFVRFLIPNTCSYSCCFLNIKRRFQMRSKRGRCMKNSAKIVGPYLFVLFAVHFHVPPLHKREPRSSHFDKGVRSLIKYNIVLVSLRLRITRIWIMMWDSVIQLWFGTGWKRLFSRNLVRLKHHSVVIS